MQNIQNSFYRVSVKALILDENKRFLLTKEKNGKWELPGGGLDFGENPKEGLSREIKEEMGLDIKRVDDNPSYFLTAKRDDGLWTANVIFLADLKHLNFKKSDECIEIRFFTKEEALKENLFGNVIKFLSIYSPSNH